MRKYKSDRPEEFEPEEQAGAHPKVQGITPGQYRSPEEFAAATGIEPGQMPKDVHYYVRDRLAVLSQMGIEYQVYLYRVEKSPGVQKERLAYLCKLDHVPDEEEIAAIAGPGSYRWKAKWLDASSGECGLLSDPVNIADTLGGAGPGPASPGGSLPAPVLPAANPAMDALDMMDRLSVIVARLNGGGPTAGVEKMMDKMSATMQQSMEREFATAARWREMLMEQTQPQDIDDGQGTEQMGAPAAPVHDSPIPPWLEQLLPFVEPAIQKLLGGGPMASVAKQMVLSSAQFQEIFQDQEKWGQAVQGLAAIYGQEKTERALKILTSEDKKGGKRA